MADYVALYRGETTDTATLIAVTVDRIIVRDFAARLLSCGQDPFREKDAAIKEIDDGRKRALQAVLAEAQQ
jgi:hypothetical protein